MTLQLIEAGLAGLSTLSALALGIRIGRRRDSWLAGFMTGKAAHHNDHQWARQEGHQLGYKQGSTAGYSKGYADGWTQAETDDNATRDRAYDDGRRDLLQEAITLGATPVCVSELRRLAALDEDRTVPADVPTTAAGIIASSPWAR